MDGFVTRVLTGKMNIPTQIYNRKGTEPLTWFGAFLIN